MASTNTFRRITCLGAAFLVGLGSGMAVGNNYAQAAQRFRPEDLESVPKSFIEGGGKSHTVLVQILQETRNNGKRLERIEQNSRRLDDLGQTLQQMNQALQQLARD